MDYKDNEFVTNPTNNEIKYIISLDNIDLDLMPMKIYGNNTTSTQRYEDDFRSFEIFTNYTDCAVDDIENTKCHICAVDVPLMFFQKHLSSAKHVASVCLTASIMKRLQSQLLEPLLQIQQPIHSVYYCESCSVAVKLSNRDKHELTTEHIDSVKLDVLLKQLSHVYVENDSEKNDNTQISVDKNTKRTSQTNLNGNVTDHSNLNVNNQYGTKLDPISYANALTPLATKSNINDEKNRSFNKRIDTNANKTIINSVSTKNDDKYNMTEKIDDTITEPKGLRNHTKIQELCMKRIEVLNSEGLTMHYIMYRNGRVEIEALSGARAIVPLDNYHGFYSSSGNIYCKLCTKKIKDKKVHQYDEEHLIKVQRLITDENFYRQWGESYNHCIFCNEIVGEIGFHVLLSAEHEKNVKKSEDKIKRRLKLPGNSTYCDICSEHINGVKEHEKQPGHLIKKQEKLYELTKNEKFKPMNYQLKRNNVENTISCQVCNVTVPEDSVNEHLHHPDHQTKYNTLLETNGIIKTGNMIQCKLCNSSIYPTLEIQHAFSKEHTKSLTHSRSGILQNVLEDTKKQESEGLGTITEKLIPLDIPSSSHTNKRQTEEKKKCYIAPSNKDDNCSSSLHSLANTEDNICNLKREDVASVCTDSENYINHTHKANHEMKYDDILCAVTNAKKNKSRFYTCTICNFFMLNNENDIKEHETSKKHKIKVELVKSEGDIKNTEYTCSVCKVIVPNTSDNIKTHENGHKHQQKLNELKKIEHTGTNKEPDRSNYCNVFVPNNSDDIRTPENGIKHVQKHNELTEQNGIETKKQPHRCTVCNVDVPNNSDDIRTHENGKKHVQKHNELTKQNDIETKKQPHRCTVCNVIVSNNTDDIRTHENGTGHLQKFNELMKQNDIETKEELYRCTICDIEILQENIKTHKEGKLHKQKELREKSKIETPTEGDIKKTEFTCSVCKVIVPNTSDNIKTHENNHIIICKSLNFCWNNLKLKLKSNIETPSQGTNYICEICNVTVPNTAHHIEVHEKGKRHTKNLIK